MSKKIITKLKEKSITLEELEKYIKQKPKYATGEFYNARDIFEKWIKLEDVLDIFEETEDEYIPYKEAEKKIVGKKDD